MSVWQVGGECEKTRGGKKKTELLEIKGIAPAVRSGPYQPVIIRHQPLSPEASAQLEQENALNARYLTLSKAHFA